MDKGKVEGFYDPTENGMECNECGEEIEYDENCMRVDHARVYKDEYNGEEKPSVETLNFGGLFHKECLFD